MKLNLIFISIPENIEHKMSHHHTPTLVLLSFINVLINELQHLLNLDASNIFCCMVFLFLSH